MSEVLEEMEVQQEMYDREKKYARDVKFNKDRTTLITFRLNHNTDADILAYLESVPNKQGLIKGLLRQRMSEEKFVYATQAAENDTPPETEENN